MLELNYALNLIMKGLESTVKELGFSPEYPDGNAAGAIQTNGAKSFIMYRGEKGRARIIYENNKLSLFCANADEADAPDDDMPRESLSLMELENIDERDLKYIFEDFIETLEKKFSSKRNSAAGKKLPTPVSKSQAKSGALAYDANTLGNRFTTIYPELRDEYKKNIDTYGEFLAEDFFVNYGNAVVKQTIKENNPTKMRRLSSSSTISMRTERTRPRALSALPFSVHSKMTSSCLQTALTI